METATGDLKLIAVPGYGDATSVPSDVTAVSMLVGPEGGFTSLESETALRNNFTPITFGTRTLRAETAPLVALSYAQQRWGDY